MSLMDDWDDAPAYAPAPASSPNEETVYEEDPYGGGGVAGGGGGAGAADVYEAVNDAVDERGDEEMFTLEKLEQNFFDGYGGIKLAICRGDVFTMAMGTDTNTLVQFDVQTKEVAELEMPRSDCSISGIFADEDGKHMLIVAQTAADVGVYYLQPSFKKPKPLSKLKGLHVTAVGWDNTNKSKDSTKAILLGTADGHFFETCISKGREDYSKQLYSLKDAATQEGHPISGLDVQRLSDKVFFILASTSIRFYEFHGGPNFEALFGTLGSNPGFVELPGNPSMHSEMHVFTTRSRRQKQFAWLTLTGIYSGNLSISSKMAKSKKSEISKDKDLMPYPQTGATAANDLTPPLSIAVSEFHFLALYNDQLQVINQLNSDIVFESAFRMKRMKGEPRGLLYDPRTRKHWVFTDRFLFELVIVAEDRNMWELHLAKKQYEDALVYCKNDEQKDAVLTKQAAQCFAEKNYDMAATYYAKTSMSFEEITLKFVNQHEPEALKTFLENKLENIGNEDTTQMTLICTWLVEIYLDLINKADDDGGADSAAAVVKSFRSFLKDNNEHLEAATTNNLLSSHGRMDELLYFAELRADFERVITHHIQSGQYKKALEVLQQHKSSELFYKFSPALMAHVPYLTVEAWIEARDQADTAAAGQPLIEPRKLIPALMRYDPSSTTFADSDDVPTDEVGSNQAVRFLLDCIEHGVTDRAIHNYLISELASQPSEEALMRFLNNKRSKTKAGGDEGGERCYDVKYALRQCMAAGKQRAVVYLYGELGLYEEAVERALALGDLQLALANAERPALQELDGVGGLGSKGSDENSELRKRLWLRIARNVAEHKKNIRAAINLMAQSEGLLKIEDILPFFPEFAKIDDFKDEICDSLDHYNQDIEELKLAMAETTESSERIRRDIRSLSDRYAFVQPHDTCLVCKGRVLTRKFCVFPCILNGKQCMYHEDCLASEVLNIADAATRREIRQLQQKIAAQDPGSGGAESLRKQLSEVLTADCPACGELLVDTIDRPFEGGQRFD